MTITLGRIYVGVKPDYSRELFYHHEKPIKESHGHMYRYVIGPFSTMAGAVFMQRYGANNPYCQHVRDAERLAMQHSRN